MGFDYLWELKGRVGYMDVISHEEKVDMFNSMQHGVNNEWTLVLCFLYGYLMAYGELDNAWMTPKEWKIKKLAREKNAVGDVAKCVLKVNDVYGSMASDVIILESQVLHYKERVVFDGDVIDYLWAKIPELEKVRRRQFNTFKRLAMPFHGTLHEAIRDWRCAVLPHWVKLSYNEQVRLGMDVFVQEYVAAEINRNFTVTAATTISESSVA